MTEIILINCPFCNSIFHTNDTSKNYYYTCGKCGLCFPISQNNTKIKSKDLVIWIENNQIITWKPKRTPALGWNTLTLLEALTDSAKTFLSLGNLSQTKNQLNKLLKVLRNKIDNAKRNFRPLLIRCEYRETNKTRCNKTPVIGIKNSLHLCKTHFNQTIDQKNIEQFTIKKDLERTK